MMPKGLGVYESQHEGAQRYLCFLHAASQTVRAMLTAHGFPLAFTVGIRKKNQPHKVLLDSGDIIPTGFRAFHTIADTSLPTTVLPDARGFPTLTVLRLFRPTFATSVAG